MKKKDAADKNILQLLREEMNPNRQQGKQLGFHNSYFSAKPIRARNQMQRKRRAGAFSEAEGWRAPLLPNAETSSASVDIQSATQVHLERRGFPSAL